MSDHNKVKQNDRVLEYIRTFGSITAIQALADLGVMRLASRISDLRKMGYKIERRMVERSNRWGEPVRVAEYRLAA